MADQSVESKGWSPWRGSGVQLSVLPSGSPRPPTFLPKAGLLLFHKLEARFSCPQIQPASTRDAGASEVSEEGGEETEPLCRLALKEECWPSRPPFPDGTPLHSASLEQLLGLLEGASGHRRDHERW